MADDQAFWKGKVEKKLGIKLDPKYKVNWKLVNDIVQEDINDLLYPKADDPDYLKIFVEYNGYIHDRDARTAFSYALKNNYMNIVRYMYKGKHINLLEAIYAALDQGKWEISKEFLYADKTLIGSDNDEIAIWRDYIFYRYGVSFMEKDYDMSESGNPTNSAKLVALKYADGMLSSSSDILHEYKQAPHKTRNMYETARNKLGGLMKGALGAFNGYAVFNYLVRQGAPITFNYGSIFADAVSKHGIYVIKNVSSKRLTNYMRDRSRANSLISKLVEFYSAESQYTEFDLDAKMYVFDYLLENDKREPKSDSYAYKLLISKFKDNRSMINLINEYVK